MLRRDLLSKFLAIPILARSVAADGAPRSTSVDRRAAALDAFLRRQVKERRAVGIAAQVVRRNGEVIYAGATGLRDPAANDPIRQDTLFRLASMTKPLTAVGLC